MAQSHPAAQGHDGGYDIVVSLGTDHHRFDRLVDWIDDYLLDHPGVSCLLQHGASRPSARATSVPRMPRPELLELYQNSQVAVVQGGPGSIIDARGLGLVPIAVPRLSRLHEVVDDHQVLFTDHMVAEGEALRARDATELAELIDAALARPSEFRTAPRQAHPEQAGRLLSASMERARLDPWRTTDMVRRLLWTARDSLPVPHRTSAGAA
ncbi:glycosyltransferase [Kocuria sp. CPCC 205258]|uniref:glycosyltransferase n=1 Tax=Kocuria sp. CPCC 205258 TaxID=3073552 RepID=UPI0034D5C011